MQRPNNHHPRRYHFPSLHNLFPHSHHWHHRKPENSIRKSIIQEHTNTYNNTLIHNLSTYQLSKYEIDVLAKGLNFSPNIPSFKRQSNPTEVIKDLKRRIDTSLYFNQLNPMNQINNAHQENQDQQPPAKLPKKGPTAWNPPPSNHPTVNTFFQQLDNTPLVPFEQDLQTEHYHFLPSFFKLKNNRDLIIKKADKSGGIVVMDKDQYINKILEEHLNDRNTYRISEFDPTPHITHDTKILINFLHSKHHINDHTAKYLKPHDPPRTPIFYGLPKIHKVNKNPLRPIVSGFDGPTDNISRYIAHHLQPLVEHLPSHIKNTKHMLTILDSFGPPPPNITMVTADVISLYTNIPHGDGLEATSRHYKQSPHLLHSNAPPPFAIKVLLEHVLKHSNFRFLNSHYIQNNGTSMGGRYAPQYANLFMADVEAAILMEFQQYIPLWKRFIDDFHTSIYRKPTDRSQFLHFQSNHPLHVKEGIIYSQGLRYNLIISDDRNLTKELNFLTKVFLARGYPLSLINRNIAKALAIPRHTLLYGGNRNQGPRAPLLPLILHRNKDEYIRSTINEHWSIIEEDEELSNAIPRPTTVYKNNTTIGTCHDQKLASLSGTLHQQEL
ncbi:uncharacterized protein [Clytia hemisphaerica]|uniref:uncharacterized protein n=1 Tax=Clytia hemisphaerica TaxID=252671 RepID=UPI0034D493DD